jgi:lipopolysaccharide export system permease protein
VKILSTYVLKEFIPPYLGSMAFFTMLLLLERVMNFVQLVARGIASVIDLVVLVFFSIPPTLALTMPMSTLMGALIAVSRLSHDGEITAMRASGVRLSSIFLSLYLAGMFLGVASFFLTDTLVPIGNVKFRILYQRLTIARPDLQVDDLSVNTIADGVTLVVDRVDDRTGDLINVTIFERGESGVEKTITAQEGNFVTSGFTASYFTLLLKHGTILDPGSEAPPGNGEQPLQFASTAFDTMEFNIPLSHRDLQNIVKSPRDMSLRELREKILAMEKEAPMDSSEAVEYNRHVMEYHKKIAIPSVCLLFVFLGTPFAITRGRSGRGLGLGIGVVIIFFYYILLLSLERIGQRGILPPALVVWLPNILFLIGGTVNLIRRARSL